GPSGGPDIRVWDGVTGALVQEFYAYSPFFTGGVYVAAGDFTRMGKAYIVTTPDTGGGPDVRVFAPMTSGLVSEYMAYSPAFTGGVRVSTVDANGDGTPDVVT